MVTEKVKSELKRFLNTKQVEDLSKQFGTYEKRVREAVKQFDVKGREAKAKGQEQLDKFAAQVKRTSLELEKHFKSLVNQEGKVLNKGLNELFAYFKTLTAAAPAQKKATAKKSGGRKSSKSPSRKPRAAAPAPSAE